MLYSESIIEDGPQEAMSTGTGIKVATVDERSSSITVIANGWKIREPMAGFTATGIKAKIVVVAVISIGRRRTEAAECKESIIVWPAPTCRLA